MSQHTEGPWIMREASYGWDVLVLDKATDRALWIAPVHGPAFKGSPHYPSKEEARANAQLITAAPDLVSALRGMLRAYDFGETFPPDHPIVAARAAIAKTVAANSPSPTKEC